MNKPKGAADFIGAAAILWPLSIFLTVWGFAALASSSPYSDDGQVALPFIFAAIVGLAAVSVTVVGVYRLALHADRAAGVPPRALPPLYSDEPGLPKQ